MSCDSSPKKTKWSKKQQQKTHQYVKLQETNQNIKKLSKKKHPSKTEPPQTPVFFGCMLHPGKMMGSILTFKTKTSSKLSQVTGRFQGFVHMIQIGPWSLRGNRRFGVAFFFGLLQRLAAGSSEAVRWFWVPGFFLLFGDGWKSWNFFFRTKSHHQMQTKRILEAADGNDESDGDFFEEVEGFTWIYLLKCPLLVLQHPKRSPGFQSKQGSFGEPRCIELWRGSNTYIIYTLQEINISHLGKRKIIFKMDFSGDMLVPRRVTI